MTKKELHEEWHCLLMVYESMDVVGRIIARKRIGVIRRKLKLIDYKNKTLTN